MEVIDGGLHPAVDGQSLDEDEDLTQAQGHIHPFIDPFSKLLFSDTNNATIHTY